MWLVFTHVDASVAHGVSALRRCTSEEFEEFWQSFTSPTLYYHIRAGQLKHQCNIAKSNVWREAAETSQGQSALLSKRGLEQLCIRVPAARTNVAQVSGSGACCFQLACRSVYLLVLGFWRRQLSIHWHPTSRLLIAKQALVVRQQALSRMNPAANRTHLLLPPAG